MPPDRSWELPLPKGAGGDAVIAGRRNGSCACRVGGRDGKDAGPRMHMDGPTMIRIRWPVGKGRPVITGRQTGRSAIAATGRAAPFPRSIRRWSPGIRV